MDYVEQYSSNLDDLEQEMKFADCNCIFGLREFIDEKQKNNKIFIKE